MSGDADSERLDKWLWAARFFKTRSLAAEAVNGGKVHVDGARVKAARQIRAGSRLTISKNELEWEVTVLAVTRVRGPATTAATLYQESESSLLRREAELRRRRENALAPSGPPSRPDSKRDRRALGRLKRGG